jgi:hypothetical protein
MPTDQTHVTLDDRRGWARLRAAVSCLVGIGVIALSAAMLALVVLPAVARFWTWVRRRDIESSGVWGIAAETAVAAGAIAVVLSFVIVFWWFWTGAIDIVLKEVRAARVDQPKGDGQRRMLNPLEELSIGLGRPVPELWVTDDEVLGDRRALGGVGILWSTSLFAAYAEAGESVPADLSRRFEQWIPFTEGTER